MRKPEQPYFWTHFLMVVWVPMPYCCARLMALAPASYYRTTCCLKAWLYRLIGSFFIFISVLNNVTWIRFSVNYIQDGSNYIQGGSNYIQDGSFADSPDSGRGLVPLPARPLLMIQALPLGRG